MAHAGSERPPITALAFAMSAVSLRCHARPVMRMPAFLLAARISAGAVALMGVLGTCSVVFHWHMPLDLLQPLQSGHLQPSEMTPFCALDFALRGFVLHYPPLIGVFQFLAGRALRGSRQGDCHPNLPLRGFRLSRRWHTLTPFCAPKSAHCAWTAPVECRDLCTRWMVGP